MMSKAIYLLAAVSYTFCQFFTSNYALKNEAVKNRNNDIKNIVTKAKAAYFRNRILGIIINGWRPYFNNIIWLQINSNEEENKYIDNIPLLEILTSLSPEYEEVWSHHGWNTAINISKIYDNPEDSWLWIKTGLAIIAEGLKFNPESEDLLTWYALILYNRGLYNPPIEEKFLRDFKESPYRVAADIYQQISDKKRKIKPEGIYYEGFVSTLAFMDIFFWMRMGKFSEALSAIKSAIKYNRYLIWLYRNYGKMSYHFDRRVKLLRILYQIVKKEKIISLQNNDLGRTRLVKKYLGITQKFFNNLDFEIFVNRITLLTATILNNIIYTDKVISFDEKIKILNILAKVFGEFSTSGGKEIWWNKRWAIYKEFIERNIEIAKYEKDGKIKELMAELQEIIKKYSIHKFLNIGKFTK